MIGEALMCMAMNIYHEARNESTIGQLAVGQVVMNRMKDPRFPNEVCEVIYQGGTKRHRCQFSWYCDGEPDKPLNRRAFQEAQENAITVLNGWVSSFLDGATHYHADYVNPKWRHEKTFIVKIDSHIFYRWD
jgi:spore germination cell wall hydrolase CwlJ-like protein